MNKLKVGSSKKVVEVMNGALSATLMVSNERILGNTSTLLPASKQDAGLSIGRHGPDHTGSVS